MKKIIFVAGGSGGHIVPALSVADTLHKKDPSIDIVFISSQSKLDADIFASHHIVYRRIPLLTGKFRRYFSFQNFLDIFHILKGTFNAFSILKRERPDLIFSKGGYVSLPVGIVAKWFHIPFIIHESDSVPGLSNRILQKISATILTTFPSQKGTYVGTPIRKMILFANARRGKEFLAFSDTKPIVLVMGGSQGSEKINQLLLHSLELLKKHANIVHISGVNKSADRQRPYYRHFTYLGKEFGNVLMAADLVISRAGSSLFELAVLQKPAIIIPLSSAANNHQVKNAEFFQKKNAAKVLLEDGLTSAEFRKAVVHLLQNSKKREKFSKNIAHLAPQSSAEKIAQILLSQ